jgi:hypothetical protein
LFEADEVAVIDSLYIPCTRRQNKVRLQISEVVSVLAESQNVQDARSCVSRIVNVDTAKLPWG